MATTLQLEDGDDFALEDGDLLELNELETNEALSPIVTRGFGPAGDIDTVVLAGYVAGPAAEVPVRVPLFCAYVSISSRFSGDPRIADRFDGTVAMESRFSGTPDIASRFSGTVEIRKC